MTAATTTMPPAAPAPERVTPEQMLRLCDDGKLCELVDGQLVEKRTSDFAQLVAGNLNDELVVWCRRTALGRSFVEATFQCFPHAPEMVRRPDVAFLSAERLAGYQWGQRHFKVAPDLTVEIVPPNDGVYELDRKVGDYFRAGVRRVWVINPEQQTVRIHRGPGDLSEVIGESHLADGALLPGFRCSLPSLFASPAAAQSIT